METQLRKIIQNNYWGCDNDICKLKLSQEAANLIKLRSIARDVISPLHSMIRAGPQTENINNFIYMILMTACRQTIVVEDFDLLVETIVTAFLKWGPVSQDCIYQDLMDFSKRMKYYEKKFTTSDYKGLFYPYQMVTMRRYLHHHKKKVEELKKAHPDWEVEAEITKEEFQDFQKEHRSQLKTEFTKDVLGEATTETSQVDMDRILEDDIQGECKIVMLWKTKESYVSFTSLIATVGIKIMGIYKLKPEVYYAKTTDFYDRMAYLCENADTDLLYFPLSGIVAYFTKTTMNKVKEISYSLTRVGYKTLKMLGKDLLSKTGDLTSAASEGISTKVQISLSNTLLILSQIESKTQDINTMIKCLLLLEELYYSLDSDSKSKNLEIYCSLMKKLYNGIFSMTDSQKEFFFRVLMRVHRVLFVSKGMVQMGNEFVSIYSKKEEDNTAKPLTQMLQQSQTFSHSIYQIFMWDAKLFHDPKLWVVLFKLIHPYVGVLVGPTKSKLWFMTLLQENNMVRWEDGTLTTPGRRVLKDMEDKEESKSLTGIDKIIDQYSRDPEIKEYFDRETLLITIKFLYKVVQGVIDNSPISLTLAVNLIPKIEKKNSQKLQDTIEEIYKEGFDDNYIYTNFMISSKKYLGSKDTTTKDFLFQKWFFKMQKIIERPFRAGWIPDFIQVFIEVMVRNKENEVMKPATLRSILSSLSEFTHSKETNPLVDSSSDSLLKSINNTFPFMFTLNTLMREQNENWKVLDFQPYFTLLGEIITSKKKYFMAFPNLNDRIPPSKEKLTRAEIEETEEARVQRLEKLNNKRKNDSMRGFYRIRNFVENVFLVCHVLVDVISLPEDQIDDSNTNTFYVIWPKFWNNWFEELEGKPYFTLYTACEKWIYQNSNLVIPEGILAPDTELEFGYYKRSTDQLNISVDIFKSLGDDEKQEALSQIMELLYSVLSEFYKMTTDDKYTKFLFNSEISCLERLKKSAKWDQTFSPILMVKIANRALQVYHKIAQNFYLDIDERVKEEVTKLLEIKDNFPPSFGMLSQTLSDIELISGNIHQSEECLNFTYDPDLDYDPEDL